MKKFIAPEVKVVMIETSVICGSVNDYNTDTTIEGDNFSGVGGANSGSWTGDAAQRGIFD